MPAVDTPAPDSSSASPSTQQLTAVQMPIEGPVDDLEAAVQKLKCCPAPELRRAREHHRRALESLNNGGYTSLSESTRNDLIGHLRQNITALNRALASDSTNTSAEVSTSSSPLWPRLREVFQTLW